MAYTLLIASILCILHSASNRLYETPATRLTIGERCSWFAGPAAWHFLPVSILYLYLCMTAVTIKLLNETL